MGSNYEKKTGGRKSRDTLPLKLCCYTVVRVDQNTSNVDLGPEFWPNLNPDRGLCNQF